MSALLMKQITEEQTDGAVADAIKGMTPASDDSTLLPEANDPPEMRQAKALARRYRLPFVNLLPQDGDSPIDYSLLSEIPVDLMVRNQFVPLRRENGKLLIDILEPHRTNQDDTFAKAKGLAEYAAAHGSELGKAMMLKVDGEGEDAVISAFDVADRETRERVLKTRDNEQIQGLFQPLAF